MSAATAGSTTLGAGAPQIDARRAADEEATLYQGIVDRAAAVTGARYVNLSWREPDGYIRGSAWALTEPSRFEQALATVRRVIPAFDPMAVRFRVDVNPAVRAVLVEGRPYFAPFAEHVRGTVHPAAARAAMTVLGLAWTHSVPLRVGGEVAGALAFHWSDPPDERARRIAEAFSAQCALTLENVRLSEALRARAGEIERSRERIGAAEERTRREIAELLHGRVETRLLIATQRLLECRDLVQRDPERAAARLAEVAEECDRIRDDDVRGASHRLHPSIIAVGLVPALEILAEGFETLDVAVAASAAVTELDDIARNALPTGLRLAVYRCVEEALKSLARASRASAARVDVGVEGAAVRVTIAGEPGGPDDGAFDEGVLSRISDRVGRAGGALDLARARGGGTALTAVVPLPAPASASSAVASDGDDLYQSIAENAVAVTSARFVSLSWYEASDRTHRLGAVAPLPLFGGALAAARGVVPDFDPGRIRFSVDVNPLTRAVLAEGRAMLAPTAEHAAGTIHPGVLRAAGAILGMRWTYSVPLRVDGAVVGALAFHFPDHPAPPTLTVADAFAEQVTLTLANARLSTALGERADELARSRERIGAAEERTRRDIAELLHGHVQTRLIVAAHRLLEARPLIEREPERAAAALGEIAAELDRIREEDLRQAIRQLHPSVIAVGLIPALQQLAESLGPRLDVRVEASDAVVALDHPLRDRIPEAVRLGIYRSVEEALANVARHAGTVAACVRLDLDGPGDIRASVSDRGVGYSPDAARSGVGMRSMRDRVERLAGRLVVDSAPGSGTTVTVTLPLGGAS